MNITEKYTNHPSTMISVKSMMPTFKLVSHLPNHKNLNRKQLSVTYLKGRMNHKNVKKHIIICLLPTEADGRRTTIAQTI